MKPFLLLVLKGSLFFQLYTQPFVAVTFGGDQFRVYAALGHIALDIALTIAVVVNVVV